MTDRPQILGRAALSYDVQALTSEIGKLRGLLRRVLRMGALNEHLFGRCEEYQAGCPSCEAGRLEDEIREAVGSEDGDDED